MGSGRARGESRRRERACCNERLHRRERSALPRAVTATGPVNVHMKRLLLLALSLVLVAGVLFAIVVGTVLSRPVQMKIGSAPPDLDAESVSFQSASGSTIHGWLSR